MPECNNTGICGVCRGRAPARHSVREGKVYLVKECALCGTTEALVSSNAEVWQRKRDMWRYDAGKDSHCDLRCGRCETDHRPTTIFIETTNRCNMKCPMCIASVQLGTEYHPPLEYFDKVFRELGTFEAKPFVELYGGEPTVRDDLLEVIRLAKGYGLRCRVVTNGLKLADEEYCRRLCEAKVRFRFSFDGKDPAIYRKMRRSEGAYEKKLKALENIKKYKKCRHTLLSCVGLGVNDENVGDLIEVCHECMDVFDELGIIPLKQDMSGGVVGAEAVTTVEDVEAAVARSVGDGRVDFFSAGLAYYLEPARSFFSRRNWRSKKFIFSGAHPNCESATFLVSDGKRYRSINNYLKVPLMELMETVVGKAEKMNKRLARYDRKRSLHRLAARLIIIKTFLPLVWKAPDYGAIFNGKPVRGVLRVLGGLVRGHRFQHALRRVSGLGRMLRVGVLPFEQYAAVESNRLANCRGAFAFEDVSDGRIRFVPTCAWFMCRQEVLKSITAKYGVAEDAGARCESAVGAKQSTMG